MNPEPAGGAVHLLFLLGEHDGQAPQIVGLRHPDLARRRAIQEQPAVLAKELPGRPDLFGAPGNGAGLPQALERSERAAEGISPVERRPCVPPGIADAIPSDESDGERREGEDDGQKQSFAHGSATVAHLAPADGLSNVNTS